MFVYCTSTRSTNQLTSEWKCVIHFIVLTVWLRARLSNQMAGIVCSLVHKEPIVSLMRTADLQSDVRTRVFMLVRGCKRSKCMWACTTADKKKMKLLHRDCHGTKSVKQTRNQNNGSSLTAAWIRMPLTNLLIKSDVFLNYFVVYSLVVFFFA